MPFHPLWLVLILVVVLIIFGPGRLPELGGAVGKAMREFRKATSEITSEISNAARPDSNTTSESTAKGSTSEAKTSNS
ncbi:MAG TPA: twin-arginine translocase TatA/TatE family subunit [Candidatus Dormibacteraeota bacterium]|jgi:sec-independent protein translocase protein TatA